MLRSATLSLVLLASLTACPLPIDWDQPVDVPEPPPPCQGAECGEDEPVCLFGEAFHDLYENPDFQLEPDEWLRGEDQLTSELERAQLILAVQQSSHSDVSTVAQALARVDEQEVRRVWFTHPASGREFVAYEYGAGDNSYGAFFARDALEVASQIHDGDLLECTVY